MSRWLSKVDAFLYLYLIMVLGGIYFLFNYIEGISYSQRAGESTLFKMVWFSLYLVLSVKIIRNAGVFLALFGRSFLLVSLFVLSVISLALNGSQDAAILKFAMYFATIAFAGWIAVNYTVDSFIDALIRIGVIVLVFHVLFYPVIGSVIDYDPLHRATILGTESYAGVFGHKNLAGLFFGMMATISLVRMLSGGKNRLASSCAMIGSHLLALAAAGAAGPLLGVAMTFVLTIGGYLIVSGRRGAASIYWLLIAFAGLAMLATPSETLYGLVGRTAGLTGRSFLWSVWPNFFWQHPIIGYGFSGFFNGLSNGPSTELARLAPWKIDYGSFENAYLDALIQFGLLGGTAFILIAARGILNAVSFAFDGMSRFALAPFAILSFILVCALNDSNLLLHNCIGCVVMFWCYFGPQVTVVDQAHNARTWSPLRRPAGEPA